ncbi:MAG: serine hydrolase domain-containing protein [Chthoniobacter sp.]|uniref:serine hydrolase domain-containing protein n=1 Tax=Chthoniobacter sp. TaxID=2510640 RepID=UPI0032A45BD0
MFIPRRSSLVVALLVALPLFRLPASAEDPAPKPIAARLQPFVDSHVLAGAVTLVASRDKVLDLETVGFADVAAKKPMAPDALFWIASMSKPITTAAFMMLVDEGKVKVDDPVEKYLPEFKGQMVIAEQDESHVLLRKPKHPILIRNIMSHTSGLAFKSPIEVPTLDLFPLATRVRSYASQPLQFEPESKYQYANEGINTVGRIIEVVSGKKYEDFLDERLFKPLGMKDTTFWPDAGQIARIAKSYKGNKDKSDIEETPVGQLLYPLDDRQNRFPMPAGGLFSSAADIARFGQMLLRNGEYDGKRYLSDASVKQMTSRQTPDALKSSYGFGYAVNGATFGHGGAYSTNISVDPQLGLVLVFMVQNAGWRNDDGKKILPAFTEAAVKTFGK